MKTKIEIKSIWGKLLFEFEKENNTVKDTVIEAVKMGADLTGADLRGADLTDADLTDADLTGADLRGADLTGADLTGADGNKIKIKRAIVFSGLYKYVVIPFISEGNEKYVKMGCFTRKLSEWESDFWNNDNEFPNNGSEKSNLRLFAFETAKKWFEIIKEDGKPV
jgi:uncharacterized protein YjbI with pentapeptide repeats